MVFMYKTLYYTTLDLSRGCLAFTMYQAHTNCQLFTFF